MRTKTQWRTIDIARHLCGLRFLVFLDLLQRERIVLNFSRSSRWWRRKSPLLQAFHKAFDECIITRAVIHLPYFSNSAATYDRP